MTGLTASDADASEHPDGEALRRVSDPEAERRAAEVEARMQRKMNAQFQALKDQARAIYGLVDGTPGVRSPAQWEKLLERAGDELGNGTFIVRFLGAERYLDPLTVAALIHIRQNLIAERERPSTADLMRIDAAVAAYYNTLRIQGWIGNLALVIERGAFGQDPLNVYHGEAAAQRLEEAFRRMGEVMLPLLDRANKMMCRNLDGLSVSTGLAGIERIRRSRSTRNKKVAGNALAQPHPS